MKKWRATLLRETATVREAVKTIDTGALQIALVVDLQERLLGTVTDGDVRRGLLRGVALDAPVSEVMNRNPVTCAADMSQNAVFAVMRSRDLRHMPLIDAAGRVVRLETLDELVYRERSENWVVLMAGGLGQRLRPLTAERPKPLLSVGGRPLLETILMSFVRQGFSRFFLAVNYKAEMVREHFGDGSRWGVRVEYLQEAERLGTAGALSLLPDRPTQPLIVMNGDLLTSISFKSLMDFHAEHGGAATMAVREFNFEIPYGVVDVADNYMMSVAEKPIYSWFINAGIYVVEPDVLDFVAPGQPLHMPALLDELRARHKRVAAFPIREYWRDIGRLEDLERATAEFPLVFK